LASPSRSRRCYASLVTAILSVILGATACGASGDANPLVNPPNDASIRDGIVVVAEAASSGDERRTQADTGFNSHTGDDALRDAGSDGIAPADTSIATTTSDGGPPDVDASDTGVPDGITAPLHIDAGNGDPTSTVLAAQGDDCLPCAQRNGCLDPTLQGGACEDTPGAAPVTCASLLGLAAVTETQVCLTTLDVIFASRCASTLQGETPCLCGDADPASCLGGTATPTGPALPLYACDFDQSGIAAATTGFTNQAFGAGQANALAQCLASWSCDCFGSQ
jgi:hypothetical protein